MKRLAVIFPGFNYSVDAPLLYYADFLFDSLGYERIHMDYGSYLQDHSLDFSVRLDQLRQHELQQLSLFLPGANHSLEVNDDPFQSMEALQKAIRFLQQTISRKSQDPHTQV